jgi:hypothetical protein
MAQVGSAQAEPVDTVYIEFLKYLIQEKGFIPTEAQSATMAKYLPEYISWYNDIYPSPDSAFRGSGGLILGFGGADFKTARFEMAAGYDISKNFVVQGQLGSSDDGRARVGFGTAFIFHESETVKAFITGSFNPQEELDSAGIEDWVYDKMIWGGGIYYRPFRAGLYIHKVDDVNSTDDHWEFYVFYWVDIKW